MLPPLVELLVLPPEVAPAPVVPVLDVAASRQVQLPTSQPPGQFKLAQQSPPVAPLVAAEVVVVEPVLVDVDEPDDAPVAVPLLALPEEPPLAFVVLAPSVPESPPPPVL